MTERDPRARLARTLLWIVLWLAVITVIGMTWHPWVVGARTGCPPGQRDGWDGHCRPEQAPRPLAARAAQS